MPARKMTRKEFRSRFGTEAQCRDYLYKKRWPDGFVCDKCGATHCYQLSNGVFQCGGCRRQTTAAAGTVMGKSHVPLTVWFETLYQMSYHPDLSASSVQEATGLSYRSAWYMLVRVREMLDGRPLTVEENGTVDFNAVLFNADEREKRAPRRAAGQSLPFLAPVPAPTQNAV